MNAPRNRHREFKEQELDLQESRLLSMMWPDAVAKMVQCAVESFTVVRLRYIAWFCRRLMANIIRQPCDEGVIASGVAAAPCPKASGPWILAATILGVH